MTELVDNQDIESHLKTALKATEDRFLAGMKMLKDTAQNAEGDILENLNQAISQFEKSEEPFDTFVNVALTEIGISR